METEMTSTKLNKEAAMLRTAILITPALFILTFSLSVQSARADATSDGNRITHFATAFETAVAQDDATAVKALLDQGMSPNQNTTDNDPLLSYAVKNKAIKTVQILLNNGADINVQSSDGDMTALMCAITAGDKSIFDVLLTKKPDLSLEEDFGDTALDIANLFSNHSPLAEYAAKALTDVKAPLGDQLASIHSDDRLLKAHVTRFSVDSDTGIATITGTVTNLGKQHYKYVEINAKFTGEDGILIDTGLDNVQSLDPNETWKFKITTLKEDAKDYKLTSLSDHPSL